jgi:hypothetical protein
MRPFRTVANMVPQNDARASCVAHFKSAQSARGALAKSTFTLRHPVARRPASSGGDDAGS